MLTLDERKDCENRQACAESYLKELERDKLKQSQAYDKRIAKVKDGILNYKNKLKESK